MGKTDEMKWSTLYSSRVASMGHSDVAEMLKLSERPEVISFAGGLPDPAVFLLDEIKDIFQEVLRERGRAALGYGPTQGIGPFREWLAERMTGASRPTRVTECLVTTGGIAAVDLICKVLLDPGDVVIVGEPSYLAALHVIRSYQGRFAGVPLDGEGMEPDALASVIGELKNRSLRPKFIYLVPSFQNPSGVTIPEDRRRKIVEIAAQNHVPVVEDAAYRDLRFEGEAPPLLASLDPLNVIHINTLSKTFNPGIRIGWVTGPEPLIETLALAKQGQDQCSTTIGQYAALAFARKGLIDRQITRSVEIYARKRDAMLAALDKYFPEEARWTRPEGGFYAWITLAGKIDTEALLPVCIEAASVAFGAGPSFYHNRQGKEHMRLCYSYVPEEQIEEGIRRLGALLSGIMIGETP
ncbi:MAG: PLP-dependent aminotransferase family protein [Deltaproteobacteria bacterium]|nr:PLP-dependent aminotransferase family protein [Deltaproteobacteria bacterium]MBW2049630.1 PLP-dependent aminotransferase family protein [Deltaproteobacteria bacterium]MBW2111028.1 PLP-dependent aminotransferase family protein [Deltaproteobacteria bacterium]MBW2351998.1 PLP-dependent aminotransferase family protein [Deltaproteobacteria bacterium]